MTAASGTPLITFWTAAVPIAASRSPVAPVGSTIATTASASEASNSRHWRKSSAETGAVVSTGPVTVPPGQAARLRGPGGVPGRPGTRALGRRGAQRADRRRHCRGHRGSAVQLKTAASRTAGRPVRFLERPEWHYAWSRTRPGRRLARAGDPGAPGSAAAGSPRRRWSGEPARPGRPPVGVRSTSPAALARSTSSTALCGRSSRYPARSPTVGGLPPGCPLIATSNWCWTWVSPAALAWSSLQR